MDDADGVGVARFCDYGVTEQEGGGDVEVDGGRDLFVILAAKRGGWSNGAGVVEEP